MTRACAAALLAAADTADEEEQKATPVTALASLQAALAELAIDLESIALEGEPSADAWRRYLKGESGVFAHKIADAIDDSAVDRIAGRLLEKFFDGLLLREQALRDGVASQEPCERHRREHTSELSEGGSCVPDDPDRGPTHDGRPRVWHRDLHRSTLRRDPRFALPGSSGSATIGYSVLHSAPIMASQSP